MFIHTYIHTYNKYIKKIYKAPKTGSHQAPRNRNRCRRTEGRTPDGPMAGQHTRKLMPVGLWKHKTLTVTANK